MTNVRFSGNTYSGSLDTFPRARISGLQGASFHPGNPYLENGGFEQTGIVNWSTSGTAAQVGADTASVGQSGSWFGYIRFRARVQTSGDPVRMYVHNQCTGATVAAKWVTNTSWSAEELAFTTTTACSHYHVGIDSSGQTTT